MNFPLIKAIIILPGTALVYVPALLVWLTRATPYAASFPPGSRMQWLAVSLFAVPGFILMAWTMRLFSVAGGGGTPAPWEPIKNFIVAGPYRHVRNPMLIGVNLVLVAEALLLHSIPIFLWMVAFVVINTIYFSLSEEPNMEKRFGEDYRAYKRKVRRWIPRISAYRDGEDN